MHFFLLLMDKFCDLVETHVLGVKFILEILMMKYCLFPRKKDARNSIAILLKHYR